MSLIVLLICCACFFFAICSLCVKIFICRRVCRRDKMRLHCVSELEMKFTHANVQGLSEILNSTERTCSLKIGGF